MRHWLGTASGTRTAGNCRQEGGVKFNGAIPVRGRLEAGAPIGTRTAGNCRREGGGHLNGAVPMRAGWKPALREGLEAGSPTGARTSASDKHREKDALLTGLIRLCGWV